MPLGCQANDYLKEYAQVTVGSLDLSGNKNITQLIEVCLDQDKYRNLLRILKENWSPKDRVLVFVETKRGCDMLTRSLRADGFQARAMHGDKSQDERDWTLKEFKNMSSTLLVATVSVVFGELVARCLPAFADTVGNLSSLCCV